MKIAVSQIQMQADHQAARRHEVQETLRAWVGDRRPNFEMASAGTPGERSLPSSVVQLSLAEPAEAARSEAAADTAQVTTEQELEPRLQFIKTLVELLTGQAIRIHSFSQAAPEAAQAVAEAAAESSSAATQRAGWGVEYDYQEVLDEHEQTRFQAAGTIRTADGQEIQFALELNMERAFHQESSLSLRQGDAQRKDPLVLNFHGTAAELSEARFRFDLDGDGGLESIPLLGSGSGFLALDHNGNSRIDSGAELFGARSGEGFTELAQYDEDGNGWIDENDAVFASLRIWQPTADGPGTLRTLAEHRVGALYLGSVATPFELRGAGNESLGGIRSSGLYLGEDGSAGSLQQIDLTV